MEKEQSFEESLQALETLVTALEQGDLPLDEALSLYEKGVHLTAALTDRLKNARLKIEELAEKNHDE